MKVQEKILMRKQISRFEDVLDQMKGVGSEKVNETKTDEEINEENVQEILMENEVSEEKNEDDGDIFATKHYDLGFLHSKIIKKVFCCLNENQQIGINSFSFLLS